MRWTSEHDVIFLREVLVHEPWKQKYGSQERGKVWEKIAESLNGLNTVCELYFKVTQRSVRDRYKLLVDNFKKREREEDAASGISPEETESDIALADIIERFEEADEMHKKQTDEKKSKNEADTHKAAEMRRRSLETFSESNARVGNEPVVKKSRNTGSETVQYLREKSENELKLRTEELNQRKLEFEASKAQVNLNQQNQQLMLQNFSQLLQQQQQQQAALLVLLSKLADQK